MYALICTDKDPNGFEPDEFCIVAVSNDFEKLRKRMVKMADSCEKFLIENEHECKREDEDDCIYLFDPENEWWGNYETLEIIDLSSKEI